ncbi:MAG TPA: transcriptional regulator NrdR [Candidatus Nanoarchaeia archaeon]|nr:transcriptional regulator NrdR [Candidatus Nanoarchaeia archaeon]
MKCPYCNHGETKVNDTREAADSDVTRRRRECLKCAKRFTTYERVEMLDLRVVKKDGSIEGFERDKLRRGILKACEKRPIPIEKVDQVLDSIESELRKEDSTEIPSSVIGEKVMDRLKKLDKIAYIRFASVYRDFADLKTFEKALRSLQKG